VIDERQRKADERKAQVDKNNQLYARVFKSPNGKQVLADVTDKFYKYTSYTAGDSHATAFKEGQRSVVIYFLERLERAEKKA
jgi:hypothetical protein